MNRDLSIVFMDSDAADLEYFKNETRKRADMKTNYWDGLDVTRDEFWQGMRDEGYMLVDAPKSKLAVFSNESGMVVIAIEDGDSTCISTLDVADIDGVVSKLIEAKHTAMPAARQMDAMFGAHCAIQNAMGQK